MGSGIFATVYLALEKQSNKKVALKQIAKSLVTQYNQEFWLRREVEIHSHLNYVYITKLHGYFKTDKHVYLVMEYCPDGNLFELKKLKPNIFDLEFIKQIAYQLALALSYLHDRSVIHWDVKLENILLRDNKVKIADFGWAVHVPQANMRDTFCGTPAYLAPEICR